MAKGFSNFSNLSDLSDLSGKTVGRLSLYRRILSDLMVRGAKYIYSHELAAAASVTAAQVRRDMMAVGYVGSPTKGYEVAGLVQCIGSLLDGPAAQGVALVGLADLGRAILAYFAGRRPGPTIAAAFDRDPQRVNRVVHGCRCYPMEKLAEVVGERGIRSAILAVPAAEAQPAAEALIRAGIRGLLNFAPTPLRVPTGVYVEHLDMTTSLEKVAFFARQAEPAPDR